MSMLSIGLRLSLVVTICYLSSFASASNWVFLVPGQQYDISWRTDPSATNLHATTRVPRAGWYSTDRWFQTAHGGDAVAIGSQSNGFYVFSADGSVLLHRRGEVSAFRFSPAGDRLAFAFPGGVEILSLKDHVSKLLAPVTGVEFLQWTDFGLVAQTNGSILLLDFSGHLRPLAHVRPDTTVLAAKDRLLYFSRDSLFQVDLAHGSTFATRLPDRGPVTRAELSTDGSKLLFATAKKLYLLDYHAEPKLVATVHEVRDLCFSPDGQSYLWSSGGADDTVIRNGERFGLPSGARSVRFSADGKVVLAMQSGIYRWDSETGKRVLAGGISIDDGVNIAGDIAGEKGVVALYTRKSFGQKEHGMPSAPPDQ